MAAVLASLCECGCKHVSHAVSGSVNGLVYMYELVRVRTRDGGSFSCTTSPWHVKAL